MPGYAFGGPLIPLMWLAGVVFVGWLAGLIMGRDLSLAYAFLVGFLGSILGGLLLWFMGPYLGYMRWGEGAGFYLASLGAGVLGAMLLLHVTNWGGSVEAPIEPSYKDAHPTRPTLERGKQSPSTVPAEAEVRRGTLILLGGILLVVALVTGALALMQS